MTDSIERRALLWAVGKNTGASSRAIIATMFGNPPKSVWCYPSDGGDLGRCIVLLDIIPEFRERLSEMKSLGREWSALVDHWGELEAMWRGNDPKLYDRMKAILNPIEDEDPNFIRLGKGAALRFRRR